MAKPLRKNVPRRADRIRGEHSKLARDVKQLLAQTPGATEDYLFGHLDHKISRSDFHAWLLAFWAHGERFGAIGTRAHGATVQFFLAETPRDRILLLADLVNVDALRVIRFLESKVTPQEKKAIQQAPGLNLKSSQLQTLLNQMCNEQLIAQVKNPSGRTRAFVYEVTRLGQTHAATPYAHRLVPSDQVVDDADGPTPCPCLRSKKNQG